MHAMTTPTQLRGPRAAPLGALRAARRGAAPPRPRAAASSSFAPAPKRVVVVGGGWAGFGAAKHLSEQGYDVTLLDAGGAGLTTPTTPGGRPVEPGVKGFWHEYPNIFGLIDELGLRGRLTEFLTSGFWGPAGLITEAPVFSSKPKLPAFLGQFVYTAPLFNQGGAVGFKDLISILPFLYSAIDLTAEGAFEYYDAMSMAELLRRAGVTDAAYEYFLKPTLQVGLFAPPEELSAAVGIETLNFYALQHQQSFDVCWCRGTIAEQIFAPLVARLREGGASVLPSRTVVGLTTDAATGRVDGVVAARAAAEGGGEEVYAADAVVLAVSVQGMQRLVAQCPPLAERREFRAVNNLKSIDCVSTTLFFDREVPTRFPANVLAGFAPEEVGATYFNLSDSDWGAAPADAPGTVIAADFYGASSLLPLSDEAIVALVRKNLAACEPAFAEANVVDSAVLRARGAVTKFAPGSYKHRPEQATSIPNLFLAGDWVRGTPEGGARGLSQERAFVTGLTAANLVVGALGVGAPAAVLEPEPDEPHVAAARTANAAGRRALAALGFPERFLR